MRIVWIDRPDRYNSVDGALHASLVDVWRELRADRAARAVVLTGRGKTFCAGGDFDWLTRLHEDADVADFTTDEAADILLEMLRFPLPVIAAVNGPAVGLGCSVAMMADIVLISDRAHLADPHVALGLVAGDGGAAFWPLLTSVLRAKEYLYTGDRIPPPEAVAMGLATRVVPHDDLMEQSLALADRLAAIPPQALRDTKRTVNAHLAAAVHGCLQAGLASERISLASTEFGAALRATQGGDR